MLAVVLLSACVGVLAGSGAAWALYHRLGPAERVITGGGGGGPSAGTSIAGVATDGGPSVVRVVTQPVRPDQLLSGIGGVATGFVVSADGLVVTSIHAVQGSSHPRIVTADGKLFDAVPVASDSVHGIALLRASGAQDLKPLSFARNEPKSGDFVVSIASPPLSSLTLTTGYVSATGRSLDDPGGRASVFDVFTVDAVGDPRNDGAPLLDSTGAVVGVVFGGEHPSLPGMVVLSGRDAATLVQHAGNPGSASGSLGVQAVYLDPGTAAAAGVRAGALVRSVTAGGPAARAGLAAGDVVTAVNGQPVDPNRTLDPAAYNLDPGQPVSLTVQRAGGDLNVSVVVGTG